MSKNEFLNTAKETERHRYHDSWDAVTDSSIGTFTATAEGRFLDVNPSMVHLFGYGSPGEMTDSIEDILTQLYADSKDRDEIVRRLKEYGEVVNHECRVRRRDGSLVWASSNARAVRDEAGNILYYQGFIADISGRKNRVKNVTVTRRIQERVAYELTENIPVGNFVLRLSSDGSPRFDFFSERLLNMLGLTRAEMQADPFAAFRIIHPEEYEGFLSLNMEAFVNKQSFYWEGRVIVNDETRWFVFESEPREIADGATVWEGVATDVTDRMRVNRELQKRLSLAQALSRISEMAVDVDDLQQFERNSLAAMGKAFEVDRVYICEHNDDADTVDTTVEWCASGVLPTREAMQGVPSSSGPLLVAALRQGRHLAYSRIDDIPDEVVKEILRSRGVLSLLVVPLVVAGRYFGFMGFDECKEHREWPPEEVDFLVSISRIVSAAIERRWADEALRESEARNRHLTEAMNDLVWMAGLDMRTFYNSSSVERILGFTPEERNAMTIEEMVTPASLAALQDELAKELILEEQGVGDPNRTRTLTLEYYDKDGSTRWLESLVAGIRDDQGRLTGIHGVSRDVTDRRKAEEDLRASETKYRFLTEKMNDSIWTSNLDLSLTYVSPSDERIFGFSAEERLAQGLGEMLTPSSLNTALDVLTRELALEAEGQGDPFRSVTVELEYYHKDGSTRWIETVITGLRDDDGVLAGLHGVDRDITDRKRVEQALRESEERHRRLMEDAPVGFCIVDTTGKIQYINKKVEKLTGFTHAELTGRYPHEVALFSEASGKMLIDRLALRLAGKTPNPDNMQMQITTKDGTTKWIELHTTIQRINGVPAGAQIAIIDLTKRKQIEEEREKLKEQLNRAQKLESIGTLAGGIAHDFNNLLMGIQGNASLVMLDLEPSHPHHVRMKHIEEQVKSASDLTVQLLGFARGGRYEVKPTDMNDIVKRTSAMFGRTKKEIAIHGKYGKDLWVVEVDRTQMEQVFMNLYVNAWQAMPGGGDIFLETDNILLDEPGMHSLATGRYVRVAVSDTGAGMDEQTSQRIFDPFFTTKGMGRGTGLGLATVYGIISSHGGVIDVSSEPGRGTTFAIYLPATDKERAGEKTAPSTEVMRGNETILLVDDEPMILDVATGLLQFLGYRVYTAASGQEAVALYHEREDEIDLVILDMIMPGISGSETFDRLREMNPKQKILLSSGYSADGEARNILERGCDGFLQKPFQLKQLDREVRGVLDGKGDRS